MFQCFMKSFNINTSLSRSLFTKRLNHLFTDLNLCVNNRSIATKNQTNDLKYYFLNKFTSVFTRKQTIGFITSESGDIYKTFTRHQQECNSFPKSHVHIHTHVLNTTK